MMEPAKRQKKGFVSEEDISTLLQRYSATKVLALLQEVAQSSVGLKIDWNALVKKTTTGISNVREYQMLWRHIAYRHELLEKVDDGAEPMEDDSDLEYELEAFPAVSAEAITEAAACVKVLSASGLPSDTNVPNSSTVEAPLTINIPNCQSLKSSAEDHVAASSVQGTNITVPVSLQKESTPLASSGQKQSVSGIEGSDANGSVNNNIPSRRKRKPWSEEEDLELIAAVRKCGEGNWANILKGDFKGDRTASQLSQRWAIIRKKQNNLNIGTNTTGSLLSEAQLAARRAIQMAFKDTAMTVGNGAAGSNTNPSTINTSNEENQTANNQGSQPQSQQSQPVVGNPKPVAPSSIPKPRAPPKKAASKPTVSSESSMVTAVAMAAGARIASPSDAASLFKAAQANNAIHIKSSMGSNSNPFSSTHLGAHRNVQLNHPAMGPTTSSTSPSTGPISHATGSQPVRANFVRPTGPSTIQQVTKAPTPLTSSNQSTNTLPSQPCMAPSTKPTGMIAECTDNPTPSSANGPPAKNQKISEENKIPPQLGSSKTENVEAKINPAPILSSAKSVVMGQVVAVERSHCAVGADKKEEEVGNTGCYDDENKTVKSQIVVDNDNCDNQPSAEGKGNEGLNGKHEELVKGKPGDMPNFKDEGSSRNSEVANEAKAAAEQLEQKEDNSEC